MSGTVLGVGDTEKGRQNALMEYSEQVIFDFGKGRQKPSHAELQIWVKSLCFTLCVVMWHQEGIHLPRAECPC